MRLHVDLSEPANNTRRYLSFSASPSGAIDRFQRCSSRRLTIEGRRVSSLAWLIYFLLAIAKEGLLRRLFVYSSKAFFLKNAAIIGLFRQATGHRYGCAKISPQRCLPFLRAEVPRMLG